MSEQKITIQNGQKIIHKDVIADAFLRQILTRPADYSIITTLNLNGDYISDALAIFFCDLFRTFNLTFRLFNEQIVMT